MAYCAKFSKISSYLTPTQRAQFHASSDPVERDGLIETGKLKRYSSACLAIGQIFEASSNAMVIVDKFGDIVLVNDKAEDMFQYQRAELIGKNVGTLIPNRYADSHCKRVVEFMTNPCCRPMGVGRDLYGVRKDGYEIPLEISLSPMKIADNAFTAAIIADITERKRAERMFRIAVEASPTAMIMVDGKMRIVLVNSKTEALFRFTRTEMIGEHLNMVIPERYRKHHAQHMAMFMRDPATRPMGKGERTLYGLKKDGTEFAIAIGLNVINGSSEGEMLILASITDITDKLEMASLIKSSQIALESSRLKSVFLANMSHEIRTPMNGIISTMNLLATTNLCHEQRLYLKMMMDSSRMLMGILNNVLDFSKIEAGKAEIEFVEFDLCDLVCKHRSLFDCRATDCDISFNVVCPKTPVVVVSDEVKVRQALLNICDNAFKFTGDGGDITIKLEVIDPVDGVRAVLPPSVAQPELSSSSSTVTVRLTVSDTGIGMPKNAMDELFTNFYQADQSTTRRYGGTGLGLAICRKLVDMLGGTISAASEEGRGSTFVVTFAFLRASEGVGGSSVQREASAGLECGHAGGGEQVPQAERNAPNGTPAPPLRMLVVEDNDINRMILQRILQKLGHSVEIATDGAQAVEKLKGADPFDMVFMDCQMPIMDGYEATKVIRTQIPHRQALPIIALTASAIKGDRERCIRVGMNEYLTKPICIDKLKQMISEFVLTV
ncbi:Histidine kinase [Plasmodiophora brassicae]